MATINQFYSCPADCTTVPFLALPDDCSLLPDSSEITHLWIKPSAAASPFTGWSDTTRTTITATAGAIDNTDILDTKVKYLKGIGSIAVPDKTTVTLAAFKTVTSRRTFTLSFILPSLKDDLYYDFALQMQCGNTDGFTIFYGTDANVFGKADGIVLTGSDVDMPKDSGRDSVEQATLLLTFESVTDPIRRNNPLS